MNSRVSVSSFSDKPLTLNYSYIINTLKKKKELCSRDVNSQKLLIFSQIAGSEKLNCIFEYNLK